MIIIPMLGQSKRFFDMGYTIPKYQLPLGRETVFSKSVRSFEKQFKEIPFLFIVRSDFNSLEFVTNEVSKLGISDFRIMQINHETRGQAETVAIGIDDYKNDLPLIIFNIDTIRYNFEIPMPEDFGDGFLEVFKGHGDGWSFIEAGHSNKVLRTTEKERISELCSNGIYGFSKASQFKEALDFYIKTKNFSKGELYIAPLYNYLINQGYEIKYRLIENHLIDHSGLPSDYEKLKLKYCTLDRDLD